MRVGKDMDDFVLHLAHLRLQAGELAKLPGMAINGGRDENNRMLSQ